MAPCNPTGRATASSSTDTVSEEHTETLANQQAEIRRLTALLAAAEARAARLEEILSTTEQTITMLSEGIVQALGRSGTSSESTKRLAKILDLATFTDN